jgi:hypothetical protein
VICALEIAMLVWGIVVMVTGKLKVSKTKEVRGMAARGLALLMIAPLPLAFGVGFIYGVMNANAGQKIDTVTVTIVEVVIVLGFALAAIVGGLILGKHPDEYPPPAQGFPVQPPNNQPPQ